MGQRTHDQLISEALLEAGDTRLTARASIWLNDWLRSAYAAAAWPFVTRNVVYSLAADVTSFTLGGGSGGVTNQIKRVFDPLGIRSSDYSVRGEARVMQLAGTFENPDPFLDNPATNRGIPTKFQVWAGAAAGVWTLYPQPVPDRALQLIIKYHEIPADIAGGQVPVYPNDRTMKQSVIQKALAHVYGSTSQEALAAADTLQDLFTGDKIKYVVVPGTNDYHPLDPTVFR
jgi:hypothetical protein